jgi:L-cysteine S-thiosulfotransferase
MASHELGGTMRKSIALLPCALALAGCGPESPFGLRLPDGDAAAGQAAFVDLRCNACHEVVGVQLEYLEGIAHVQLGGETTHVKTHGQLVTSIINPSHKIAPAHRVTGAIPEDQSVMSYAYLNDVMTVQQLIDLVAFLQPTYELVQPPPVKWAVYQ